MKSDLQNNFYLYFLSKTKSLSSRKIVELLSIYNTPQDIIKAINDNTLDFNIKNLILKNDKNKILLEFNSIKDNYISIIDKRYPELLKNIYDPPLFIYYKGDIELLNNQYNISIVGSRKITTYHNTITKDIIHTLKDYPFAIISGLAFGVDSLSHRYALYNNLKTVAILPSSLDNIYPFKHIGLAEEILNNNGLLISEYPSNTKLETYHFPKRNRIIAGLSNITVVVSGTLKSGTLITAQVALDEGREVYALPGNINNLLNQGPNYLIQNGAQMINNTNDILKHFNI